MKSIEEVYIISDDMQPYVYLLYNIARECGGDILEIGVRRGQSTMAFLAGLRGTKRKLYSIDRKSPERKIMGENWRFILGDSRKIPSEIEGRTFSVLMIDGDHSEEGVRGDWKRFRPFVTDFAIFHDIGLNWLPERKIENGADKLWKELQDSQMETLTFDFNKYGLGIVRMKTKFFR